MNPITVVKQHPWLTGGVALLVIGGALLIFGGSGGSDESSGPMSVTLPGADAATVQAGAAIQAANIEGQAHIAEVNAAKETAIANASVEENKAKYEQQTAYHLADVAAGAKALDTAALIQANTLSAAAATRAANLDYRLKSVENGRAYKLHMADIAAKKAVALASINKAKTKAKKK